LFDILSLSDKIDFISSSSADNLTKFFETISVFSKLILLKSIVFKNSEKLLLYPSNIG
jgi:hypothetical protein